MLSFQDTVAITYSLFNMYYVFNKILFDYLKTSHQISPEPGMQQTLMLLTSNIPLYDFLGLNDKILDKPLTRKILDKDTGSIYSKHKQTLTYVERQ